MPAIKAAIEQAYQAEVRNLFKVYVDAAVNEIRHDHDMNEVGERFQTGLCLINRCRAETLKLSNIEEDEAVNEPRIPDIFHEAFSQVSAMRQTLEKVQEDNARLRDQVKRLEALLREVGRQRSGQGSTATDG